MKIAQMLTLLSLFGVMACTVKSIAPGDTMEMNMDFDLAALDMRHGWFFTSSPQVTHIGELDKDAAARGEKLFVQHCQKCHGPSGVGDGPLAQKLKIKPANLKSISKEITNTYLVVQINRGKGNMPNWEDLLTTKETYDLTAYIRTLKDK